MTLRTILPLALAFALPLAACQEKASEPAAPESPAASDATASGDNAASAAIGEGETVRFTGTEPFWGGEVGGGTLTYSTPENIDGAEIAVTRFAGLGGVSFSGTLDGAKLDLLVTEGECSDGMSDRAYPFVATLSLGGEVRNGCAWTDARPATGGEAP